MDMQITKHIRDIHPNSLFIKIACVVVSGVLVVSVFTLGVALQTTRDGYVETLSRSNEQIMTQVEANMEKMNDTITDVVLSINNSWAFMQYLTSNGENPLAFRLIYDMTKQLNAVKPNTFYDVAVVGVNGLSYVSNQSSLSLPVEELLKNKITQEACGNPNQILYRYVDKGITQRSKGSSAFVALKALAYPGSQTIYGFAYVVMQQQDLQGFFDGLSNSTNNLMLMDGSGDIVSAPNKALVGQRSEELAQVLQNMDFNKETSRNTELNGNRVIVLTRTMTRWKIHIVSAFDYMRALNELNSRAYILTICLLVIAVVLAFVFFFIRQITHPINTLVHKMATVTGNGLPDHIELTGGYEARQLAGAFNAMTDDINGYVQQLMQLEKEKRRMEVHTLQMQINPHFIYNTLTSIKWLVWQGDSKKVVQCVDTFTLLLRSTISDRQELIPVSEEVENLEHYVFLQKIRFGNQVQTNIYLGPSAKDCRIPKLLLQPFLENSFFHAFTNRQYGMISVFIDRHGTNLTCEVIDDGVGMPREVSEQLLSGEPKNNGHSIGLRNVNARIQLLFGNMYGVKIFSEPERGTTVKVTLPAILDTESQEKSTKIENKS